MSELTIFHNARCSKSRATLELLEGSGKAFRIVNYLEHPPAPEELDALLKMLGREPREIARDSEDRYEELGLGVNPPRSREEWLKILCQNPVLIERPIVTDGKRAVLGRPPENVLSILR